MRSIAFALLTLLLASACSAEPPAEPAASAAPPPAQAQPVSRPAEPAAPAPAAEAPTRVAQVQAPATPVRTNFVAGEHYTLLNPAQPTNVPPGKVEVVDVFWYGCGGCYVMHPYMDAWKASKPEAAQYVRLPAALNPGWQPQARLYFATKALGIEDRTHSEIFRELHVNRNPLNTMELQIEFLRRFGVSEADAREALTDFTTDSELRAADVRARRFQLRFVPAVVVNGKYVVSIDSAGGPEKVGEVINYLVALESGALGN